jgi:MraZ protein
MDGQLEPTAHAEAPLGFLAARVDEKGRLKIPASILQSLKETRVFITTFDKATVQIYPIAGWRVTEFFLEKPGEKAEARGALRVRAKHYGADAEIDGQGRVLLPTTLRRELELEGMAVFLECVNGHVEMLSDSVYQAKLAKSDTVLAEQLNDLLEMGLP